MVVIIGLTATDQRFGDVRTQIRRERADDSTAAAGHRLRALEFDDSVVSREARHIRLDGGFVHSLLTRERGQAELVAVPWIYHRRGLAVGQLEAARLSESHRHIMSGRSGSAQRSRCKA